MPNNGWLDLHSHVLPGIDDGCSSFDESLECVRHLLREGFVGSVCTPHYFVDIYPENVPVNIERHVAVLRERLQEAGLDYQLWTGAEVRIADDTISWFEVHGVPTLGDSSYVLIDFWGQVWLAEGDAVVKYLLNNGYRPILAHPERMDFPENDLDVLIRRLKEMGVWLQGNSNSLGGGEGKRAQDRIKRWLRQDAYDLIATDMHEPIGLKPRLEAISVLADEVGSERRTTLLHQRPRQILTEIL